MFARLGLPVSDSQEEWRFFFPQPRSFCTELWRHTIPAQDEVAHNHTPHLFPPRLIFFSPLDRVRGVFDCVMASRVRHCRLSTGCDSGGIQGGMNFENGGQLGKVQQFADQIAGAASLTEHWLACAVNATDMSAPRPAASIISTPLRSITTRRVWGASSANSRDSTATSGP